MRLKRFEIDSFFLKELLVQGRLRSASVVKKGIPQDAVLIHIALDYGRFPGVLSLTFEHESFKEHVEGEYLSPEIAEMVSFDPLPESALDYQKRMEHFLAPKSSKVSHE